MERKRHLYVLTIVFVLLVTFLTGAAKAAPSIRTARATGQRSFVDPIVSPGERSAHEHCFYGAVPVTTVETSDHLRGQGSSWAVPDTNHTAIWIPCPYEDGQPLIPSTRRHLLAYYKPIQGTECVPPDDMAGVSQEYGYRRQTGGGTFFPRVPAGDGNTIVITVFWRGERDFGVSCFPNVQAYIRFQRPHGGPLGTITLGGPTLGVDGARDETTMHGDYFFGWDRAAFERFLAQCIRPGVKCEVDRVI